jgi:hypothetical protein
MIGLIGFITSHRAEFLARLGEHVVLVLASTAIAAALGIPLGVLAARRASLAKPIVALANLAQTIPSLALFGFLIPLPFIGGHRHADRARRAHGLRGPAGAARHDYGHSRCARGGDRVRGRDGPDVASGAAAG